MEDKKAMKGKYSGKMVVEGQESNERRSILGVCVVGRRWSDKKAMKGKCPRCDGDGGRIEYKYERV